jgi:hypothetical protein
MTVRIVEFDATGWSVREELWGDRTELRLAELLEDVMSISSTEAEDIAESTLSGWEERGGRSENTAEKRGVVVSLGITFGLAALGLAVVVAGIVVGLLLLL